jgi:hypothetical protein
VRSRVARAEASSVSYCTDGEGVVLRVNRYDILSILFRFLTGIFGVVAGLFQNLSNLAGSQSNFHDSQEAFRTQVSLDIESLGGE